MRLLMYEHKGQPPISNRAFARRLLRHSHYAAWLVAGSIVLGMLGYRLFAHFPWTDAFLETCMLLGGMGPVNPLPSEGAKLFAGVFALYSGLVFLCVGALLLTPIFHRVLHRFHWEAGPPR